MAAGVGLALSAFSAFAQLRKGQAQQAAFEGQASGLEVQAQFTRFNAKQESLKHKAQAVSELEKTLVNLASINAAAGAGNVDPFSGNPFGLKVRALDVGGSNYAQADNNRAITVLLGNQQADMQLFQASRARAAGKAAKQQGVMGALLTLGTGAFNFAQAGGFTAGAGSVGAGGGGFGSISQPFSTGVNSSANAFGGLNPPRSFGNASLTGAGL